MEYTHKAIRDIIRENWPTFEKAGWNNISRAIAHYQNDPDQFDDMMVQVRAANLERPNLNTQGMILNLNAAQQNIRNLAGAGFTPEEVQAMLEAPAIDGTPWSLMSIMQVGNGHWIPERVVPRPPAAQFVDTFGEWKEDK